MIRSREQLCPVTLAAAIGLSVVLALVVVYPHDDKQARTLSSAPPSELSIAYLEAWLRLKPDSPEYLGSLGSQYLKMGRWTAALGTAQKLKRIKGDESAYRHALLLDVAATEQITYQTPPHQPQRRVNLARFIVALDAAAHFQWDTPVMESLADKALRAGAHGAMLSFYKKLAAYDSARSAHWQEKVGEAALATKAYDDAAFAYFAASEASRTLEDKRNGFINALKVLRSANQVTRACEEGARRLGTLAQDRDTVKFMLELAREGNRSDLVARYGRALMELSPLSQLRPLYPEFAVAVHAAATYQPPRAMPIPLYSSHRIAGAGPHAQRHLTAAQGPVGSTITAEYDLVFQAFLESNQLTDAQAVAQRAMDAGLEPRVWAQRLAQVARWNNQPDVALKYGLIFARASGDPAAWAEVLSLAPHLDDDKAYLEAWSQDSSRTAPAGDLDAGLDSLLAEYMKLHRWESALRMIGKLRDQGDAQTRQRILASEITALEQSAYSYPVEDPRRAVRLGELRAALERADSYPWDVAALTSFAGKAEAAGAHELMSRYYRKLVVADRANAIKWQAKLGDAALARQAYDDAAMAYFAAQDMATTEDSRRQYFIAALKVMVAQGRPADACNEAEKRAGELAEDPETLRYLVYLARQAGRGDLMARYARDLIKFSTQSHHNSRLERWHAEHPAKPAAYAEYKQPRSHPLAHYIAFTQAGSADNIAGQEKKNDFDLAFQAFLESNQLDEAEALAQRALQQGLDPLTWMPRLAQVAQWNNHPETALQYWFEFAQASGDAQAWSTVRTMAPQLGNDRAYVGALEYFADLAPADLSLVDGIVAAYERLNEPNSAMAYLQSRATGALRIPILERSAALAERTGNLDAALGAYRSLLMADVRNPLYAMHVADLLYRKGDVAGAMIVLRERRQDAGAQPEAAPYWRLYAKLAGLVRHDEDALYAHRQLLATGQATPTDLDGMLYLYESHPIDAGRLAEAQFVQNKSMFALQAALRHYTEARAWGRIEALLSGLSLEQRSAFDKSSVLLATRATYLFKVGRSDAGLADLRRAVQSGDAGQDIRIAYLWGLIGFGSDEELRLAMYQWRDAAKLNSAYWGVFAAAGLRMDNPAMAVQYLRQQRPQMGQDPSWLLALADAEEAAGYTDRSREIRLEAWRLLESEAIDAPPATRDEFRDKAVKKNRSLAARASLSPTFASGDYSRGLLLELLRQERRSPEEIAVASTLLGDAPGLPTLRDVMMSRTVNASGNIEPDPDQIPPNASSDTAKAIALGWAISGEHNDLANAWLAREYIQRLSRLPDAEVALALQTNDQETLGRVLDSHGGRLTADSRVAALVRTGRTDEAQTIAFHAAEGAPDNDDRYETSKLTLMRDRPAVGADILTSESDPLSYVESAAVGGMQLTGRVAIGVEAIQRNQRSTDKDQLPWVPAHDREFNLTVRDVTVNRDIAVTVGHRKALDSFYTLKARGDFNRQGPISTTVAFGLNQFTNLSAITQVGAVKDYVSLGAQWSPPSRWFAQASAQANRFYAQDRTYLGHGFDLAAGAGYRIRATHPSWNVRMIAQRGIYSASDNVIPSFSPLTPGGRAPFAAEIMPQNFTQLGLVLGFGSTGKDSYSRAWRPFFDLGYVHDSNQGWGPYVTIGVGGSVLGRDNLRLLFLHQAAPQGGTQRVTQIGLSYRLFF
ncbi:tetratricopeptide repeat protein [Candidimonas sp. SYP-B2681]|uniref:tetratricopeptide repeat protein n=1 Tax=Candidimonas sp. SYP-B2681 TaxID=2497686 RepID=UPI000F88BAF3|nr:tetratricopeptide repeat protein [Candidimonas sp. SYP-B2681]RTZ47693.1 tetratricopeptide repeat protein [Candidimonas sp. SYP-B2681]